MKRFASIFDAGLPLAADQMRCATREVRRKRRPYLRRRASVLVIVMVTVIFAVFALVTFMDKASNDLLVEHRDAEARRLRREAYSALEVTLSVLNEFRQVLGGLRSPAEGWGDPLTFAGYEPGEGRQVIVTFEDESGKISLPRATAQVLTSLFKTWNFPENEAQELADAIFGWMHPNHIYTTGLLPSYEQSTIPYLPPARSLRSYQELAAIDKFREAFYDAQGKPNELWRRFTDSVSLLNFQRPNINGAKPDTLAAVAQFDPMAQQNIADYLNGTGPYKTQGPGFFQSPNDALRYASGATGDVGSFAPTISALRVFITVIEGRSQFRLATVVTQNGAATAIQTNATATREQTSAASAAQNQRKQRQQQQQQQQAQGATAVSAGARSAANPNSTPQNLRYPFTVLEIRENDEIPPAPPPPTDQTL